VRHRPLSVPISNFPLIDAGCHIFPYIIFVLAPLRCLQTMITEKHRDLNMDDPMRMLIVEPHHTDRTVARAHG
jgi:hypothetical protein